MKSKIKLYVLYELKKKEMTGYDILGAIEKINGKKPSTGYLYPLLHQLNKIGYINMKKEGRKKIYMITDNGKKYLSDLKDRMTSTIVQIMNHCKDLADKDHLQRLNLKHKIIKKYYHQTIMILDEISDLNDSLARTHGHDFETKLSKIKKILRTATKELKTLKQK